MKTITKEILNEYVNNQFKFMSDVNGYFLQFYNNKQIILYCLDNVKNQIKKSLIKRNILIEYETSKITESKPHKTINFYLLRYETNNNNLSVKALFKKYGIKEKEKRKDIYINALIKE